MKKNIIIPTLVLFLICLVSTGLLAFANDLTEPIIEKLEEQTEIESRKAVLADAAEFKDEKAGDVAYAVGYGKDGAPVGLIFTTTEKSYGGDVKIMTGVDMEGKVKGVEILSIEDTAGLGMNAQKESFRSQFIGLVKGIVVQKNSSSRENNEITALTGATITSKAVTAAVNQALDIYASVSAEYAQGGANNG